MTLEVQAPLLSDQRIQRCLRVHLFSEAFDSGFCRRFCPLRRHRESISLDRFNPGITLNNQKPCLQKSKEAIKVTMFTLIAIPAINKFRQQDLYPQTIQ